eukprot:TRINITY_DN4800_c0_g1_i2.p1 TRINITY_DN4800_c0_g1~~TRINITY_DN4800_c0_g1_i2.p1  ORF type:complete len:914 (-),score=161.09 TRINITY_DN4800_c0_g1_i2:96-2801(-)
MGSPGTSSSVSVKFSLEYSTTIGYSIAIIGSSPILGDWSPPNAQKLTFSRGYWSIVVSLPRDTKIEYKYVLVDDYSHLHRWEGGSNRFIQPITSAEVKFIEINDLWKVSDDPGSNIVFQSAAFEDVIFKMKGSNSLIQSITPPKDVVKGVTVELQVIQQMFAENMRVHVAGSCEALGNWEEDKSLALFSDEYPAWKIRFQVNQSEFPISYKFFVRTKANPNPAWEIEGNHDLAPASPDTNFIVSHHFPQFGVQWKGAGVAVPVFSLRTKKSFGVGEFLDLKVLVDWAILAGLRLVQLLPINDTMITNTWWDSYPYSSISVFALHPMYINLEALNPSKDVLESIQQLSHLNEGFIQYDDVVLHKMRLLRQIYEAKKEETLSSKDYKEFIEEHSVWLRPYALFCHLRDKYQSANYYEWPNHTTITSEEVDELTSETTPHYDEIQFVYFVQFHLSQQLQEASRYATEKGIVLKGDLPIGVDPRSVDSWYNPELFKKTVQVGAPPDAFSEDGQNWGFPAYDWDAMKQTGYAWWKKRLSVMEKYFHALRIDHILGFFRIWEIPSHCVGGLLGRFNPSIPIWHWELEKVGIWDFERLTKPYIRDHHFDVFGQWKNEVKHYYFWQPSPGVYEFKEEFNTEAKIDGCPADGITKSKLFSILRNVVLIRSEENPFAFFPRIAMFLTDSFMDLNERDKKNLYDLYISYFYQRQDELWRRVALEKLTSIQSASKMLICGEDLGMIPDCVPGVMTELSLLGLRIQRMPADSKIKFDDPEQYPYMTVCTPSVHDTSTLRLWWEEDRSDTAIFYREMLKRGGNPPHFCEPWVVRDILRQHFGCPSMWAIICIQDFFALEESLRLPNPADERINVPANRHHYWRYRIQVPIEDLIEKHPSLHETIREDLKACRRLF